MIALLFALTLISNGGQAPQPQEDGLLAKQALSISKTFAKDRWPNAKIEPAYEAIFNGRNSNRRDIGVYVKRPNKRPCWVGITWIMGEVIPIDIDCGAKPRKHYE